jgi:hypothetical protein
MQDDGRRELDEQTHAGKLALCLLGLLVVHRHRRPPATA